MTVTYGFYNSLAGDRKYNAIQLSSLFDGIILDGVFEDYGDAFAVTPNSGMDINVGTGRAWFNHTWTLNDDVLVLTVDDAETVLKRIDTVILEVNTTVEVRTNTIKILKGTPSSTPVAPTLTNAGGLYQYALYDIFVEHAVTEIVLGNITSRLGTDTPYVIGVIETSGLATLQDQIDDILATSENYRIVPSISSNNLVLAIKGADGNDPSATNKIVFYVGNTEYVLSSATSFTKVAGTDWCDLGCVELATNDVDLFMYAIGETGASAGLKFGYSRIPWAVKMGDFVNTSTSEKYIAGNWTNFNSSDAVKVIGRFRARMSAGAGYTWSIPNSKVINQPIFKTDMLTWTPQYTGFSVVPTGITRYFLDGKILNLCIDNADSGSGTSNLGTFTMTIPFYCVNLTNLYQYAEVPYSINGGTSAYSIAAVYSGPNSRGLTFVIKSGAGWVTSGAKGVAVRFNVEIE